MPEQIQLRYEDMKDTYKSNLDSMEYFFYTTFKKKEDGKESKEDAWYAARIGLRKIGTEGILESLDAQVEQSIRNGDGIESQLSQNLSQNSRIFIGCAQALKVKDLISDYIKPRLGGESNVAVKDEYKEKMFAEISSREKLEGESDDDAEKRMEYGQYLLKQLKNAAGAKIAGEVYVEKAEELNKSYNAQEGDEVMVPLPNGARVAYKIPT